VDFGVGLGWCTEEYEACGAPSEGLHDASLRCSRHRYESVRLLNRLREEARRRQVVARHGDGWLGLGLAPDAAAECLAGLGPILAEHDRKLEDIQLTVSPHQAYWLPSTADDVRRFGDADIDEIVVWCTSTTPAEIAPVLDEIAARYLRRSTCVPPSMSEV
jgi:hypothetical protein